MKVTMTLLTKTPVSEITNATMYQLLLNYKPSVIVAEFDESYPVVLKSEIPGESVNVYVLAGHPEKDPVTFVAEKDNDEVAPHFSYAYPVFDVNYTMEGLEDYSPNPADIFTQFYYLDTSPLASEKGLSNRDQLPVELLPEGYTFNPVTDIFIEEVALGHRYRAVINTEAQKVFLDKTVTYVPEGIDITKPQGVAELNFLSAITKSLPVNLAPFF